MIAYNTEWLKNLFIREQAAEAFDHQCLDKNELENINNKYTLNFYSPNFFIRVGLFLLTTVIVLFSFALFSLMFLHSIDEAIGGMAIFFALVVYAILEYVVRKKNHLQSGVDDALLWISASSLFGGISHLIDAGGLANCLIIFFISLFCTLRFADRVMSMIWYISLLGIFFFSCTNIRGITKQLVPFILMIVSGLVYLSVKKIKELTINLFYSSCLQIIAITALISFYLAGNYFVVRELSNEMFHLNLDDDQSIPFGWVFWIFTFLIPCLYITWGIQKKDILLIRVALVLAAVIIFTVRYYYAIASLEVVMTTGGILLVLIAYGLNRYLREPRRGFTSLEIVKGRSKEKIQIESVLLAQTFASHPTVAEGTKFGGGNFGGGGASGDF